MSKRFTHGGRVETRDHGPFVLGKVERLSVLVDVVDLATLRDDVENNNLSGESRIDLVVVQDEGPSGWPEVKLTGDAEQIRAWLAASGYGDGEFVVVD